LKTRVALKRFAFKPLALSGAKLKEVHMAGHGSRKFGKGGKAKDGGGSKRRGSKNGKKSGPQKVQRGKKKG